MTENAAGSVLTNAASATGEWATEKEAWDYRGHRENREELLNCHYPRPSSTAVFQSYITQLYWGWRQGAVSSIQLCSLDGGLGQWAAKQLLWSMRPASRSTSDQGGSLTLVAPRLSQDHLGRPGSHPTWGGGLRWCLRLAFGP